eukprot:c23158_g1_i2 orf=819-2285(+)
MADGSSALQGLPAHLLHEIFTKSHLSAADLARLEASCYAFRAEYGMLPYRFKSVPELAAFHSCQTYFLFSVMPYQFRSQLLNRCGGNWKLVLRFLQCVEQAYGCVSASTGNIQVATGKYHTLIVHGNGELYSCGSSLSGVLGQGPENTQCRTIMPVEVPMGLPVTFVSGSHQHAAFVTKTGELFTYGDNSCSCCGHGEFRRTIFKPMLVAALKGIPCKQVATGLCYTVVLTKDGQVYTCGVNSHGQLGHGDTLEKTVPCKVEKLSSVGPVVQVSAGASHTLAVTQEGAVYSFGYGANFCLGHGELASEVQPRIVEIFKQQNTFVVRVAAGDEHSVALDSNGHVFTWGKGYCGALGHGDENDKPTPELVASLKDIRAVQVCAKKRKTFVLDDEGIVYAFGWMGFGSLGLTDRGNSDKILNPHALSSLKKHRVSQISTGLYHTVVITTKGTILGFGDNERGQLGLDHCRSCLEPKEINLVNEELSQVEEQ